MIEREHGGFVRARVTALAFATVVLTTTVGACLDESVEGEDVSSEAVYLTPPPYGGWSCDQDGDGHANPTCDGEDCNDLDATVYPGHGCPDEPQELEAGCISRTCCKPIDPDGENPLCPSSEP